MEQNVATARLNFNNPARARFMTKQRILILDDQEDILEVVRLILDYEQYEVTCTRTAKAFNKELANQKPDLIILDYRLPDANGGEICRQLKSDESTCRIPIILFSAYFSKADDLSCYLCNEALTKPFDMTELTDKVRSQLSLRGVSGSMVN